MLHIVPTKPKLNIGDNRTSVQTAMILDKEAYFVTFNTDKKMIPTIANTQKPNPKAYPNITETAFPPLKLANIGKQ